MIVEQLTEQHSPTNTPKIGYGIVQLIRIGKSIKFKLVKSQTWSYEAIWGIIFTDM